MDDRDLYQAILGLSAPWKVERVDLRKDAREVDVYVQWPPRQAGSCPECGAACAVYDHLERRWRHLDTCQFKTILIAQVPRVNCPAHGVKQMNVPWAGPRSQFTALFEGLVVAWLKEASILAVAAQFGLSWEEAHGIQRRAVDRGLARRKAAPVKYLGVDEKSFLRGHKYVSVLCDIEGRRVLEVTDGRTNESAEALLTCLTAEQKSAVEGVAMDMWEPYAQAARKHLPQAAIVFDKFHVAKHLNEGVDKVRRQENRELASVGDRRLKGTKYQWLRNPETFSAEKWAEFATLRNSNLKVARAWALKETAMTIFDFRQIGQARKQFDSWYTWAIRSRLEPMKEKARMLKRHASNVLTYVTHRITNAVAEGLNSKIQWLKYTARGYRNRENFRTAILFHCGGLDLAP